MLNSTFIEKLKDVYPNAQIKYEMFKIEQTVEWDYKTAEQFLSTEIELTPNFYNEIESHYPEALI
jgi:hypothetical protein